MLEIYQWRSPAPFENSQSWQLLTLFVRPWWFHWLGPETLGKIWSYFQIWFHRLCFGQCWGRNNIYWKSGCQSYFAWWHLYRLVIVNNGILLPKLFWHTVRKNCSSDREKLLKFEAESREFSKNLRSLEQFIQTVKGQNNFW